MPKALARDSALEHFLGFDPALAITVTAPGRAPWNLPPTEDPRVMVFEGFDGDDLVDEPLQGSLRRRPSSTPSSGRMSEFEIHFPSIPMPTGFVVRDGCLGWRSLRDLRQFLREAFPPSTSEIVSGPSAATLLLEDRDALVRRIDAHVHAHPELAPHEDEAERTSLEATLRALREQWDVEDLETEREILAEEEAARHDVVLPPRLDHLVRRARRSRRPGRPTTTSLVVQAARLYGLRPRDAAMLVALERGSIAAFEPPYDMYFDPRMSGSATAAWNKVFYR